MARLGVDCRGSTSTVRVLCATLRNPHVLIRTLVNYTFFAVDAAFTLSSTMTYFPRPSGAVSPLGRAGRHCLPTCFLAATHPVLPCCPSSRAPCTTMLSGTPTHRSCKRYDDYLQEKRSRTLKTTTMMTITFTKPNPSKETRRTRRQRPLSSH